MNALLYTTQCCWSTRSNFASIPCDKSSVPKAGGRPSQLAAPAEELAAKELAATSGASVEACAPSWQAQLMSECAVPTVLSFRVSSKSAKGMRIGSFKFCQASMLRVPVSAALPPR